MLVNIAEKERTVGSLAKKRLYLRKKRLLGILRGKKELKSFWKSDKSRAEESR